MDNANEVDIRENFIMQWDPCLLQLLLVDRSSGHNIIWATNNYASRGKGYGFHDEITTERITGENGRTIRPRVKKSLKEQTFRSREKGEVFTPAWVCNFQNNVIDEEWYGESDIFNHELKKDWLPIGRRVPFPSPTGKSWKDYVKSRRLEITCGEAPYLTSRYDATTGGVIPVENRIGILDRKLRIVAENTRRKKDWYVWARQAFCSTYGYEWQGDSLLLARENLLFAYVDNFKKRWGNDAEPLMTKLRDIAKIISWNIWQMDGLKGVVPDSCHDEVSQSKDLFENSKTVVSPCPGCSSGHLHDHNGIFCILRDWEARGEKRIPFIDFLEHTNTLNPTNMKFDFIIGNPPYQEETVGNQKTFAPPIYDKFIDETYKVARRVELIHPARFLFNAGGTSKAWNEKMLADPHLKVLYHEQNSACIFPNTDIKGGVVVTYHDVDKIFGAIEIYTAFDELNAILQKVKKHKAFSSFSKLIYNRGLYRFSKEIYEKYPVEMKQFSDSRINSSSFERLPALFTEKEPHDREEHIQVYGLLNGTRVYRWFRKSYVNFVDNLDKYKVFVPKANGSGALGEVLSTPVIGQPVIGHTETFLSIGCFDSENEAEACLKYVKSKFARIMLGILKITQDNSSEKWKYVPLQDFTSSSDIDWSKSIPEIDRQLYAKYGLDEKEIEFIETHVKEMQ